MAGVESYIPLISVILSGGLIIGLLKVRPEAGSLASEANERAVASLLASMTSLEKKLEDAERKEAILKAQMGELREEIAQLRSRLAAMNVIALERDAWKQRALDLGWDE